LLTSCTHDEGNGALKRALGGEPTLDPQRSADTYSEEILRDLYEGLTVETPTGDIAPGVARVWSVSPDGLRYTFELRTDTRWSNGDPVVAEDFVAGFRRAVDPKTVDPEAQLISMIRNAPEIIAGRILPEALGVTTLSPHTIEIHLDRPAPYLPELLAHSIAYPIHRPSLAQYGDKFTLPGHLVSNGAYRLVSSIAGSKIRLERNPYYWDREAVAIPAVEYFPIPDGEAQLLRYRAGELGMTDTVPDAELAWAKRERGGELQIAAQLGVVFLAFNVARAPFTEHPELAEALSLAIDREMLTQSVLHAGQVPGYSFVPPSIPGYTPHSYIWAAEPMADRLIHARALLTQAGYGTAVPLRVRLLYHQNETLRNVAVAVAAQWKEALGIEADLLGLEFRGFLGIRQDRSRWDVMLDVWNADYADPGGFLDVFHSGGPQNDPGLSDKQLDRLLEEAGNEVGIKRRRERFAEAERQLLADNAVAPVYFLVTRRLVSPRVEGAVLNPMNHNYSKYLRLSSRAAAR
jgi:oligopeptide transport system substrate-binding protein